jgi:putative DNA primase/helicase
MNNPDNLPMVIEPQDFCEAGSPASQGFNSDTRFSEEGLPKTVKSDLTGDEFEINTQGVYWLENPKKKIPLCGPLRVIADARDQDHKNWARIIYLKNKEGITHIIPVRMEQIDGESVGKDLRSHGLTVTNGFRAKEKLVIFLQECPAEDPTLIRLTNKTGWHEATFVLRNGESIGPSNEPYLFENLTTTDSAFSCLGDLKAWQENVAKLCQGNSRLIFAVSMAFAAPLLAKLEAEGGGFNLVGDSSTGKSTAVFVAASVCGPPGKYVESWRATANGLELMALKHNDVLMALDEMGEMAPQEIGGAAYMLANGQGKQRMKSTIGLRERYTWKTLIISSGELTLADHMLEGGKKTRAGQEVRLADIPADAGCDLGLFENLHGAANGAEFANLLKDNASRYYGTVFRPYIEGVIELIGELRQAYNDIKKNFHKEYLPADASSQVRRQADRMALIALAGEIATSLEITGWDEGTSLEAAGRCFLDWVDMRGGSDRQEVTQIIRQARHFIEVFGDSRFVPMVKNQNGWTSMHNNMPQRAGYKRETETGFEYLVMPEVFRDEICKGYNRRSVIKVLVDNGMLQTDAKGKSQITCRLPAIGNKITVKKMYVFTSKVLSDEVLTAQ